MNERVSNWHPNVTWHSFLFPSLSLWGEVGPLQPSVLISIGWEVGSSPKLGLSPFPLCGWKWSQLPSVPSDCHSLGSLFFRIKPGCWVQATHPLLQSHVTKEISPRMSQCMAPHLQEPSEHPRVAAPRLGPLSRLSPHPCWHSTKARMMRVTDKSTHAVHPQWGLFHPKGLFWFSSSCGSNKLITDDKRLIYNWTADKIVQVSAGGTELWRGGGTARKTPGRAGVCWGWELPDPRCFLTGTCWGLSVYLL